MRAWILRDWMEELYRAAFLNGAVAGAAAAMLLMIVAYMSRTAMGRRQIACVLLALGAAGWLSTRMEEKARPRPEPRPGPNRPEPRPRRPWLPRAGASVDAIVVGGPAHEGIEVTCDLPIDQRTRNVGGRDGAGLCVFTSIGHAARWQNERRLLDFQNDMRQEPGGGYPAKVDRMIARYGAGTPYLQYEGRDLSLLREALAGGRMPSVTYDGRDPHYRGSIAHMVNLVHLDDQWACVLDNNFIGARELVWLDVNSFASRFHGNGNGWAVFLLAPPPPPPPR